MVRRRGRRARKQFDEPGLPVRRDPPFEEWWREAGFRELRQLLLWRWDPIGVADHSFSWAESEYDMYARPLAELLHDGATAEEVYDHLERIAVEDITVGGTTRETAELIVRWFEESRACHREFGDRGARLAEWRDSDDVR